MNITKEEAYELLVQAREKLLSEGLGFPKIDKDVNIKIAEDGDVYYAFDFNINEEKFYRFSLVRLEQIICELRGEEWKPIPDKFGVFFDNNFDKRIPEKWYTSSGKKPPGGYKKNEKKEKIRDTYQTYSRNNEEISDGEDDNTYNNIDISDTYSE